MIHVESANDEALWWMDLSAADPMATATELLSGPYFPSRGHSDGHYAFVRSQLSPQHELDGVLLDISTLPPIPIDPGLPLGHFLRDGEVSPEGDALLVRAYDELEDSDRLWRIPIDDLGDLGAPELLTDPEPFLRLDFPQRRAYSADASTLAAGGWSMWADGLLRIIDLANAAGPIVVPAGGEPGSPSELHLTPDGGELVMVENPWVNPYSYGYWADLDGPLNPAKLGNPQDMLHWLGDWANDDRTVLWGGSFDYEWKVFLHVIEIQEAAAVEHPVDLQGMSVDSFYFHEGGEFLLLSTADSLYGASVVASQPGPLFAIAGAALGEADLVDFVAEQSRTHALVTWEHDDLTRDCEIVSLADAAFAWTWAAGPCKSIEQPRLRADHLYFSLIDVNDATASGTSTSPIPWRSPSRSQPRWIPSAVSQHL